MVKKNFEIFVLFQKYVIYLIAAADYNISYMLFLPKLFGLNLT